MSSTTDARVDDDLVSAVRDAAREAAPAGRRDLVEVHLEQVGPPPGVSEGAGGVRVVATSAVGVSAMEALGHGTVEVVDGCLGLRPDGTDAVTVVAWPGGSEALEDEVGVRLPGGREPRVGDHLEAGGGEGGVSPLVAETRPGAQDVRTLGDVVDAQG